MKDIKFRKSDEKDWMAGLEAERAEEKNPFFKWFNRYADVYYREVYRNRPDSAFCKVMEHDDWCRFMSVEGIPGSGSGEVAKKLAEHKNLIFSDRPDLYYLFTRYGLECPMQKKLSHLWKHGQKATKDGHFEGDVALEPGVLGNWYEERYEMSWDKVYNDPDDQVMACRVLSHQFQAFRIQEMDRIVSFLLGMRGMISDQNYFSMRAEIHAMGETGRIPQDMYQSMIDHYQRMEGGVDPYAFTLYVDIDPEEAYDNIQKSDKYTPQQKEWYTLEYLKAYQEGYEEFVLPTIQGDSYDTLVHRITHEQSKQWDIEFLCDDLMPYERYEEVKYHFFKLGSLWHPHIFARGNSQSFQYMQMLVKNMDIANGQQIRQIDHYSLCPSILNKHSMKTGKIVKWDYPRPWVNPGLNWDYIAMVDLSQNAMDAQVQWFQDQDIHGSVTYGFAPGWNKGEFSWTNPKDIYRHLFDCEAPRIGHLFGGMNEKGPTDLMLFPRIANGLDMTGKHF